MDCGTPLQAPQLRIDPAPGMFTCMRIKCTCKCLSLFDSAHPRETDGGNTRASLCVYVCVDYTSMHVRDRCGGIGSRTGITGAV